MEPANNQFPNVTIEGSLEEWEPCFLGSDEYGQPKKWTASRFRQQVLIKVINELNCLYPEFLYQLHVLKSGRKVIGYRLDIHSI